MMKITSPAARRQGATRGRRRVAGSAAILAILLSAALSGVSPVARAATIQLAPSLADSAGMTADMQQVLAPAPIGSAGDYKDYYRIDAGCPLLIQGPGPLRFFVRAHVDTAGAEPSEVTVVVSGLTGFADQTWTLAVKPSSAAEFGDGRAGGLTGGERVSLAIPSGLQGVTVTGTSDTGGPVYAIFYYEGPPVGQAETAGAAEEEPAGEVSPQARAAGAGASRAAEERPAAKRPAASKKARSPWTLTSDYSMGFIYDDNICRYSDASLTEFNLGLFPERYAIETEDDLIVNPAIAAEVGHAKLLFDKQTRVRVRYQRWQYARNDIKTNEEINLRLRQNVRAADYFEATYTYAPYNYIKQLSDRPPFESRTVERVYLPFEITRNSFSAAYFWRAKSWARVRVSGSRVLRYYNRPFLENDLWEWSGQLYVDLRYKRWITRLQYGYADVQARAYDEVGETRETSDNDSDGSYEKDSYLLRFSYAPGRKPFVAGPAGEGLLGQAVGFLRTAGGWIDAGLAKVRTAGLDLDLSYQRQFYTSPLPLDIDPIHVGRLDETRQIELTWTSRPVYRQVSLEAGWRFTERTADAPAGLIGEEDPSEEKDYTGSRYWIAFSTPLL